MVSVYLNIAPPFVLIRVMLLVYTNTSCVYIAYIIYSAFDTVDHPVLINRLSYVGVGGTALQWFHSYLSSRSQSVQIRDTSSPSTALNFSVPQGSVLGPPFV